MGKATAEQYQGEYSLVYMDIDDRLNYMGATATAAELRNVSSA